MNTLLIVQGLVTLAKEDETKNKKKVFKYQIESNGDNGKRLGYVRSWVDRGFKVGDTITACGYEQASLYQGKIFSNITLLSVVEEKSRLAMLGITQAVAEKQRPAVKV
ncbi:MAG: hypothetical protein CVU55_01845 [Deltaproteobacteria bacterium HGW-Deltaproteobacteria-13]|jgi:hypothetical protein|nr:MAG: hypothetical protein CVU55_01845 [Deltaproteobacteria bacterium HGW-Deltaproteobacteria-13]